MRSPAPLLLALSLGVAAIACGSVDEPPLGGPFGGSTDPTDPNGGSNGDNTNNTDNNNTNDTGDSGTNNTTNDSGTQTTKDSGTQTKDSGTQTQDSGSQTQGVTWTSIFNGYMASGTKGKCNSCHSQGSSATKLYTWLQGRGYISGTSSALVSTSQSCLSWFGGNMPPSGPSSYGNAVSDMKSWAAAGAPNN